MEDSRGPIRQIIEIQADRESLSGGNVITPVLLSCGHIAQFNTIFHYKVGDDHRCFDCGPHGAESRAAIDKKEAHIDGLERAAKICDASKGEDSSVAARRIRSLIDNMLAKYREKDEESRSRSTR